MANSTQQKQNKRWQLLTAVTTQREVDSQKRISFGISETLKLLGLDIGILSSIVGDTYTVIEHNAPEGAPLYNGQIFDLGETYCAITLKAEQVVAIDYMKESPHNRHPCYEAFQLETYIGTPVFVDNKRYGTLNFSSPTPNKVIFEEADKELVDLLAIWVGAELERASHQAKQLALSSELELRTRAMEASIDPIIISDAQQADNPLVYVNKAFETQTGYSREEVLGRNCRFLQGEDKDQEQLKVLRQALKNGENCNVVLRNYRKNGEMFWNQLKITAIRSAEGQITHFVGVQNDITNRLNREQTLLKRSKELEAVSEVATAVTNIANPDEMLQQVVDLTKERFNLYHAHIFLMNERNRLLELTAGAGEIGQQMVREGRVIPISAQESLVATSAREQQPQVRHYEGEMQGYAPHPTLIDTRTELALPLVVGDRLLGVLDVRSDQKNAFDEIDQQVFFTFAAQIAIALQNVRQFEQSKKQATQLKMVSDVSANISQVQETQELIKQVVDLTKERFDLYHSHIYLLNDIGNILVLSAGAGEVGDTMVAEKRQIPFSATQSLVARAAQSEQAVIVNDVRADKGFLAHPLLPDTAAEMAIPIISGRQLFGVLDVQATKTDFFDPLDAEVFFALATQIAVALQNAQTFRLSEETLEDLNMLTRRLTNEGWDTYLNEQEAETTAFAYDTVAVTPLNGGYTSTDGHQLVQHPIILQDTPIGALALAEPEEFTEDIDDILAAVASNLSTHIENLRLTEETQNALANTQLLYYTSEQISRANTVQAILQTLVEATSLRYLHSASIIFFEYPWYEDDAPFVGEVIATWESMNAESLIPAGAEYSISDQSVFHNFRPTHPIIVNNLAQLTTLDKNEKQLFQKMGVQSTIGIPINLQGQWVGILNAYSIEPKIELASEEVQRINNLANQAATSIENRRLFKQTQSALAISEEQVRRLALLTELNNNLNATDSLEDAIQLTVESTPRILHAERVSVTFIDTKTNTMEIKAMAGTDSNDLPTPESQPFQSEGMLEAIKTRQVILAHDVVDTTSKRIQPIMYAPIVSQREVIGTLNIASNQTPYNERDKTILAQVVNTLSAVIEIKQLFTAQQQARLESEELYAASRQINEFANDLPKLAELIATILPDTQFTRSTLYILDSDERGDIQDLRVVANWHSGQGEAPPPTGARYARESFAQRAYLFNLEPLFISNCSEVTDDVLSTAAQAHFATEKITSIIVLPLIIGTQQIGTVLLESIPQLTFLDDAENRYISLAPQIAATMQNRILFDQAEARARREQVLREITERVRNASDVNSVMKTAVAEVGRVLGRKAFVYLKDSQS